MTAENIELLMAARLDVILRDALSNLTAEDVATRLLWCHEQGETGTRVVEVDDGTAWQWWWGGRPFAVIDKSLLEDADSYLSDIVAEVTVARDERGQG